MENSSFRLLAVGGGGILRTVINDNIAEWNHSHPGNYLDQIILPSGRYYGFNNNHNSGDLGFLGQIHDYINSNIKANIYVPALNIYFQYDLLEIKQATLKTIKKP